MNKFSLQRAIWGSLSAATLFLAIQPFAFANSTGEAKKIVDVALLPVVSTFKPELPPLDPAIMQEADSLEVRLLVRLRDRRVYLYQGDELKVSYPIAVGRPGWETPKGNFKVIGMEKNPVWKNPWTGDIIKPGPDNPMGERAIDFWTDGRNYAAFHGTPNESAIGQAVSHGCLRMRNADIRAMYDMVAEGTPVIIEP